MEGTESDLKILQVAACLHVGGLENVAMDCYREAKQQGHEVDFLVFGKEHGYYEDEVIETGGRVFHIPSPSQGYYKFYQNVKRIVRENGPYDIVHSHTFFNSGLVLKAAKSVEVKKCIAHCHSSKRSSSQRLTKKIYNAVMRQWILQNADVYCACSRQAGVCLFGEKKFSRKGILLVNKIETEKFKFNEEERRRVRVEFGISTDCHVLGTVGHLTAAKNQKLLIDIFSNLYAGMPGYKLLIVGDGELREQLEKQVQENNIQNQVIFTGTRTDVPALLSAMDVFLLTSKHEGLGIVLLEAQANGLPCIGIEEVIAQEVMISDKLTLISNSNNMDEWRKLISKSMAVGHNDNNLGFRAVKQLEGQFNAMIKLMYAP